MDFTKQDLTNQKFNKLLVISKTTQKNSSGSYYWRCICECGNETLAIPTALKRGHKTSCGCIRIQRSVEAKKLKLKGKRFGRILVLEETSERKKSDGKVIWKGICDCGNEVLTNGTDLIKGKVVSCGCYQLDKAVPIINAIRESNLVENTKLDSLTQKIRKDSSTGVKGVYFNKKIKKYQVYIKFQKKQFYLGSFETLDEAKKVRLKAEEEYFHPILSRYGRSTNKKQG